MPFILALDNFSEAYAVNKMLVDDSYPYFLPHPAIPAAFNEGVVPDLFCCNSRRTISNGEYRSAEFASSGL